MSAVTTVYKNVRGLKTAIKDVGRLREISLILAKHGFGAIVVQLGLTETIGFRGASLPDSTGEHASPAARLRLAIEELGPTFIKLGQILSTRPDLLPMDVIEELQKLQNDVPPMEPEDVKTQIFENLGTSSDDIFASFSNEPLACASIAQVHVAELKTGEEVIVKVQRRNIHDKIDSDLNILHFLAARAEDLVPELQLMAPVGIVREFDKALRQELDFTVEKNNIERFNQNFEGFEGLRAPKVYEDFCAVGVLTMERIKGVKITDAVDAYGVDPYKVAPTMIRALFKMILQDGHIHGDLHPGNIFVCENGEIVLIDFGLCGKLLPRQREGILELLIGVAKEDYEKVARSFFDMGEKVPGVRYDFAAFESDVVSIMEKHILGKTLQEVDVQSYFSDLVSGAIRHQIRMPATYTMVFKALMTVEGIGKVLAPEINFLDETRPFIQEILVERYSPKRILREASDVLGNFGRLTRQFTQSAPQILRDLEQGNTGVKSEILGLKELAEEQRRLLKMQTRGNLTAAAFIAGAVLYDVPGTTVLGMSIPTLIMFIVGALTGFPLIFSMLRRG